MANRSVEAIAIPRAFIREDGDLRVCSECGPLADREFGTTFLVVTHDARIADRCNRLIEIVDGLVKSDRMRPGPSRATP